MDETKTKKTHRFIYLIRNRYNMVHNDIILFVSFQCAAKQKKRLDIPSEK